MPSSRQTRELCGTFPSRVEDYISSRCLKLPSFGIDFNEYINAGYIFSIFICSRSSSSLEAGRHQHLAHISFREFNSTVSVEVKPSQMIKFNTIKNTGFVSHQKCQNHESIDNSSN